MRSEGEREAIAPYYKAIAASGRDFGAPVADTADGIEEIRSSTMQASDRILALDTLYVNSATMLVLYGLQLGTGRYYEAALLIATVAPAKTDSIADHPKSEPTPNPRPNIRLVSASACGWVRADSAA